MRFFVNFLLFALLLSRPVWAEPFEWPDLTTDKAQVAFLMYAEKLYPELFEGMTAHDTDLLMTLSTQQKFLNTMAKDARFKKLFEQAAQRKDITIDVLPKVEHPPLKIDAKAFAQVKQDAEAGLALLGNGTDLRGQLQVAIGERLQSNLGATVNKTVNRMVSLLPEGEQKPMFAKPLAEKLKFFASHQPSDAAKAEELQKLLALVPELEKRDRELKALVSLAAVVPTDAPLSHDMAAAQLRGLSPQIHAPRFADGEELLKTTNGFLSQQFPDSTNIYDAKKLLAAKDALKDSISDHTKALKDAKLPKPPKPLSSIRLTEVPAPLAILRGCIGGDCASKNLAAYAQSPHTRVFYIDTGRGTPGGYFETAEVTVGGKKYLYAFTVNGTGLNDEHVDTAIRGLFAARKDLGVEGILLPEQQWLKYNINYNILRDKVSELIKGRPSVDFEFMDAEFRRELFKQGLVNSENYHSPDKIKSAVVYEPPPLPDGQTVAHDAKAAVYTKFEGGEVDPGRALMLAIELSHTAIKPKYTDLELKNLGKKQEHIDYDHGRRVNLIDRVLEAGGIPKAEMEHIRKLMRNEAGLPFAEAVAKISEALAAYGYQLDPTFKKTSITPFLPALLRSPDAFAGKWKDTAARGTLTLLGQGVEPELVSKVLGEHPDLWTANPRLKNMMLKSFKFENTYQYYPGWALAERIGNSGLSLDLFPEVKTFLMEKLNSGDRYHEKAAAGALARLNAEPQAIWDRLQQMKLTDTKKDPELDLILRRVQPSVPRRLIPLPLAKKKCHPEKLASSPSPANATKVAAAPAP